MRVSEVSRLSGVSVHRLRRYEALGLLMAARQSSGYREFAASAVREAVFIDMSRELGFSLLQIADVLPRYRAGRLSFAELEALFRARIAEVDAEIAERRALRKRLLSHIDWLHDREARQKAAPRKPANAFTRAGSASSSRRLA